MKHNEIIAAMVAILALVFIVFCVLMATPAAAYEGDRVTTRRQDALHEAAEAAAEKQSAKDRAWCKRCIYANTHDHVHLCNYILITGKMRGCPAGAGCERRATR